MRSLSDSEVLDLVDAGRLLSAEGRAISILRLVTGEPEETLAHLPRARRDALLIDARAQTIGPRLEACIACGGCGTLLEATVECRDLAVSPPDAFELTCDACGTRSSSAFDIRTFFWRELAARARHILLGVHELARAYGWRESEVLSLSPTRRQRYLELVGEPAAFDPVRDQDEEAAGEGAPVVMTEPREPDRLGHSNAPRPDDHAPESEATLQPSAPRPAGSVSADVTHRSRRRDAAPSVSDGVRRGPAARPAQVAAAASRRGSTTSIPAMSAVPHVTVNIARLDVVATPAQASTITARHTRREASVPLSTYLAQRETETR
jgi:hypothetical protein